MTKRYWCSADIGFYADSEQEAERLFEEMVSVACRGEIGMGLHVCRETYAAALKHELVDMEEEYGTVTSAVVEYP